MCIRDSRWNRLQKNPVDAADPPRLAAADAEMKVWNAKELKVFLAAERSSRLYPLWLTLATTGMRRGESLGLRWEDVDLNARRLSIRKTRVMLGYAPHVSEPTRLLSISYAVFCLKKKKKKKE